MSSDRTVVEALEEDLAALATAGTLKANTQSVQAAMRVLAQQLDLASTEVREKTAALRELRASLDDVKQGGSGVVGQTFRERVAVAGTPVGNAVVRRPKHKRLKA